MPKNYIIAVDDDPIIHSMLPAMTGLEVVSLYTFADWSAKVEQLKHPPVGVFLDVILGNHNGLDLIIPTKKRFTHAPVIVMTSNYQDAVITQALSLGADDFLTKPLRPAEVHARLVRRTADVLDEPVIRQGNLTLSRFSRTLSGPEGHMDLSDLEFKAFSLLMANRSFALSRERMHKTLWASTVVSKNSLDQLIKKLRGKLALIGSNLEIQSNYGGTLSLSRTTKESA